MSELFRSRSLSPLSRVFLAVAATTAALAGPMPLEIRMEAPARNWEKEALPVGNGRIGAMVYGDPIKERIQFNEVSLWSGGENESGGYDVNEFGTYQSFGDLLIETPGTGGSVVAVPPVCPSGHKAFVEAEEVAASIDGDPGTKWCVEHGGKPVVWEWTLPAATRPKGYAFVTANDVPARDPRTWTLEGKRGGTWVKLDARENHAGTAKRGENLSFALADAPEVTALRFTFQPPAGVEHFQVAEILLPGINAPAPGSPDAYERVLDLSTGVQRVAWTRGGARHTREVYASRPQEVIVVHWTCNQPGGITANFRLADPRAGMKGAADENGVLIPESRLSNGLRYAARAFIRTRGGTAGPEGDHYAVKGADEVVVLLAAATDYLMDPEKNFRSGESPAASADARAIQAGDLNPSALRRAHVEAHAALMGRVELDLGASPGGSRDLPVSRRITEHAGNPRDRELEVLVFQYGRYLLASSSRPGGLPANLQGLWADGLKPAWFSDYHTNINLQMNYWQAEPANLADAHVALFDWIEASIPASRRATVKAFGEKTPGWTMRTSVNAYGGNGWEWNLPASAWLAQHFWEHFAFGRDKTFLRERAWPVFRDVSEFWLDHLKEDANGKLVVPKGWSPEHGPREDGVAHDQQIVWDLFTNTLEAAQVLGIDDAFTRRVAGARGKLLGPQVGSWGQLMEWTVERNEEKSGHRHTSHLFAVYPGRQISMARTPEWAKAAAVSLEARGTSGDSRRSWTWPWRAALWARLGEPEKAHAMVHGLFQHNTLPNLWTTHPPFQMDGNFGITAGMTEMLLQSHAGEIVPLPALPAAWKDGRFKGLRARGGFTVDATWKDGRLTGLVVHSTAGEPMALRLPAGWKAASTTLPAGLASDNGAVRFNTTRGQSYSFRW